jgi:hypothetical protein
MGENVSKKQAAASRVILSRIVLRVMFLLKHLQE